MNIYEKCPTLESEKFVIRLFKDEDVDDLLKVYSDKLVLRALDELIVGEKKILDCAAGTGVYAFYLADKGHDVTATDISPRK